MTLCAAALLLLAGPALGDKPDISQDRAAEIKQACGELVTSYAYSRDRLHYEAYGELFTDDATFELGGRKTVGREAIVAALRSRGANSMTRHFSLPVSIEPTSQSTAKGIAYLQLFMAPANSDSNKPQTLTDPPIVAEYHDEYEIDGTTCRFQSRRIEIVFNPPTR